MNKITLAAAACCMLVAGGAAAQAAPPIRVQFGVGETSKTLQLTRDDINARAEFRAAPSGSSAYLICDMPDNATALQRFITENPDTDAGTMKSVLQSVYQDSNAETIGAVYLRVRNTFDSAGASGTRVFADGGAIVAVSSGEWSTLGAGRSVISTVKRRCLNGDQARAWLRETTRVLSLYYGLTPPQ